MKRKEMEKLLGQYGFKFIRSNKHLIYSNGIITVALPSRTEFSRGLSRRILQQCKFDKEFIQKII